MIITNQKVTIDITGLSLNKIVTKIEAAGFKIGRTSVQKLVRGKVSVACGFSVVREVPKKTIDFSKSVYEISVSELIERSKSVLESIETKTFFS